MADLTKTYQIQLVVDPPTEKYLICVGKDSARWQDKAYRMLYSDKRNHEWEKYGPEVEQYNDNSGSCYPPIIFEKSNGTYKVNYKSMYPAFIANEETRILSIQRPADLQIVSQLVGQTWENYLNGVIRPRESPKFKPIVCCKIGKREWKCIDNRLVGIIIGIGKDKRLIPFVESAHPKYINRLKQIVDSVRVSRAIYIKKHSNGKWYAHIPIKVVVADTIKQPKVVMGIDVGIRNSMTGAIVNNNKTIPTNILQTPGPNVFNKLEHIQKRIRLLRSKADKGNKNCRKALRKLKGKRRRIRQTMMRQMTAEYIKIAKKNEVEGIVLEDLKGLKPNLSKKMNRLLTQWGRFENANFIKFKTKEHGLNCKLVEPRGTSTTCPKCGIKDKKSRHGAKFKCVTCGFALNSDVVGAINIARRGYNYWNSPKWGNSQSSVATPVIAETHQETDVGGLSPPNPSDVEGQSGIDSYDKPLIGTNGAVDFAPRSPPMRSGGILSEPENVSSGCMEVNAPGPARPGNKTTPVHSDSPNPTLEPNSLSNPNPDSYRKENSTIETSGILARS